jgi:L-fuculose-phosphate aldolase
VAASPRQALASAYRGFAAAGLGSGSSGNVSLRSGDGMLITPSGVGPDELRWEQVCAIGLDGDLEPGQLRPSSEWPMHAALYRARPDAGAIVHCHSRHATILACAHRPLPAVHYMIAAAGVAEIPLAPYATFGTLALAEAVVATMANGKACLLANHGLITLGTDLAEALRVACEVEELAAIYIGTLGIGGGVTLSTDQMDEVLVAFADYGQQGSL